MSKGPAIRPPPYPYSANYSATVLAETSQPPNSMFELLLTVISKVHNHQFILSQGSFKCFFLLVTFVNLDVIIPLSDVKLHEQHSSIKFFN